MNVDRGLAIQYNTMFIHSPIHWTKEESVLGGAAKTESILGAQLSTAAELLLTDYIPAWRVTIDVQNELKADEHMQRRAPPRPV